MMSYKQWFVLLVIYIVFMLVGSVVFMYLEVGNELADRQDLQDLKKKVIDVVSNISNESRSEVEDMLFDIGGACSHDFLHLVEDEPLTWSLWNSFFFTFTVITTIGFGHMSPATPWGKVFCILYATVGVPLNGIVIASLADLFSTKVVNSRVRARAKRYQSSWLAVAADAICYLLPGFIIFLVIPAAILVAVEEGWDYLDSFYYAFITLTTIGFGDYVAGRQETDYVLVWLYKIISFFWIIFGLGYIIVSITFIQKALKSKKVHNIERKMAKVLKKHTNKMNENVHYDLKRLRKVLNTISAMRGEDDFQEEEKPKVQNEKKQQKDKLALEPKADYDEANQDRAFYSHQNSPYVKRESIKRMYSTSDADAIMSKKDGFLATNSLGSIHMFLDMVETLLKEHEADAAKRADDEARQFMDDTANSKYQDSNSNSDEETPTTPADKKKPKDVESGFINFVCTGDDDKVIFEKPTEKNKRESTERRNSQLQRRLSCFLGVPSLPSADSSGQPMSLPTEKVTKASDLIGIMENFVSQSVPDDNDAFSEMVKGTHRVSSTVPRRYKYSPERVDRLPLRNVFQADKVADSDGKTQAAVSQSGDQEKLDSNTPPNIRTENSSEDSDNRHPTQIKKDSDPESKSESGDSSHEFSRL